jgi:hypothetical protein
MPSVPPSIPGGWPTPFLTMRPDAPIGISCVPHGGADPTVMVCLGDGADNVPAAATYWDGKHHVRCDGMSSLCRVVYPSLEQRRAGAERNAAPSFASTASGAFCHL